MDFQEMINETFPLYEDMDDMEVAQTIWRRRGAEILGERLNQQLIEKAIDFISKRFYIVINNQVTSKENYNSLTELIRDFEQAMKGE